MADKNIRLVIQYDGSRYGGWQRQENTDQTIQGKIEQVLERMAGSPVTVDGSGRTDAGVHALRQTANFHLPAASPVQNPDEIRQYLNRYLPDDIAVTECTEVPERFHSRLNAVSKTYLYRIETAEKGDVFERKYVYRYGQKPDVEKMRAAASFLVGTHDFRGFSSLKRTKKSTVRTLEEAEIQEKGSILEIRFTGNGFLYNMVRILTGTLIEAGMGERTPESVREVLETGDRAGAGFTAPPEGLFLADVKYPEK